MLFIIGMPGAGKTYWGVQVAAATGQKFVDLEAYIEQGEGAKIKELFDAIGEDAFRKKEHQYLARLIDSVQTNTVIACGGGTPCFHHNIGMMKQAGKVIYLSAEIDYLIENIKKEPGKRPLLIGKEDLTEYLATLLQQRRSFYEQAQYILPTENITLTNFTQIIR